MKAQGKNKVQLTINGKRKQVDAGTTLLEAAQAMQLEIPHLCYSEEQGQAGNCRACMVEVQGERTLAAACCRKVTEGMVVHTHSDRARAAQQTVLSLLGSRVNSGGQPTDTTLTNTNELNRWQNSIEAPDLEWPIRPASDFDFSHPAIAVNMAACIHCTRCVRACREAQGNDVIGLSYRGHEARITFDQNAVLGQSSCVACGECIQACPTGALQSKTPEPESKLPIHKVDSLCPYCGVGCQATYHVQGEQIVQVTGQQGPANQGRLCVKGRYGFDYVAHPDRLTQPLIRKDSATKQADRDWQASVAMDQFRPATWDEVFALIGSRLTTIKKQHGKDALAGFGSAKCSNEEAYLFQKMIRTGFGNNHVDHCTRLCHASSVAALLEGLGSGAVSNPVRDVEHADVIFLIGANPTVNHPVAATWIKNAVARGAKLIVADPRHTDLTRLATHHLQFKADTDVAMLNALLHVMVAEELINPEFIARRVSGFEAFKANIMAYTPELMAPVCGIDSATLREVARLYATAETSMILWGMGIAQHIHGTDNARCLIAMSLLCGHIGRPGTGLHPLRGQNNVQGASDAGLIPMVLPDYQKVDDPKARAFFEDYWGAELDPKPGMTVVEIMRAAEQGKVHGMYIMGENPAMSDPDLNHARKALANLDFLVVQDIFMTETAALADVVLPASAFAEKTGSFTNTDRTVQLARQVRNPPGDARQDLWIIQQIARTIGLNWKDQTVGEVFDEMCACMPELQGMNWTRLQADTAITYPCRTAESPGEPVIFREQFPTVDGKGKLVPVSVIHADELPDATFQFVLMTGRQLEHWHTGSMSRRASALDALQPEPVVQIHPSELVALNLKDGDWLQLSSRRGQITAKALADKAIPPKHVFMAFCYRESAINKLTNPALDPVAKIPELKFCAVKVGAAQSPEAHPV